MLEGGSFAVTFLSQLTAKDITANKSAFTAYSPMDKGKFLLNTVIGRITGINVFNDMPQVPQTINPAGMVNKYTGLGILFGMIYPKIPHAPEKGVIGKLGKGSLLGGVFGGLFDAPKNGQTGVAQNGNVNYSQLTGRNQGGGTLP